MCVCCEVEFEFARFNVTLQINSDQSEGEFILGGIDFA